MTTSIKLNREQIAKLNEIVEHFNEITHFTVEASSDSGIGTGIVVKFDLLDSNTNIDITDYREW